MQHNGVMQMQHQEESDTATIFSQIYFQSLE